MKELAWTQIWLGGFLATLLLTTLEAGSQTAGLTRMSIPYLLGTAVVKGRDRAKAVGFLLHLVNGQIFALLYALLFEQLGASGLWRGALFGLTHAAVVLLVIVPLLPRLHPRMATEQRGPTALRQLEPPGPLAIHYGFSTPLVVVVAHVIFGAVLGALYRVH